MAQKLSNYLVFFNDHIEYDEEAKEVLAGEQVPEVMAAFKAQLEELEEFTPDGVKAAIKAVQKTTGHKAKICLCQSVL